MAEDLLVRGKWLVTGGGKADKVLSDAAVLVTGDRIRAIGDWQSLRNSHPEADVLGSDRVAVMPGLINAHHHSSGVSALQHAIGDDLLEPWILAHQRRRASDLYLDTLLSAERLLRSGVTAVVDVYSGRGPAEVLSQRVRRALRAYDEAGLRVSFACGISDQSHLVHGAGEDQRFLDALPAKLRAEAERLVPGEDAIDQDDYFAVMAELWRDHRAHSRIDLWYGPPGPQWVSDPFLQRIAEAAEAQDTGIQSHVNESIYEKLHGEKFYGKPTLTHLRDLGLLSPRFSLAHGVWLNEEEIAILAESGAAVSHNPSSNLRLRAGIAPLSDLLASGATVALGMDGTTLNDDEDMFTEMRLALRLQCAPLVAGQVPRPSEIFEMATAGGAKLLRRESLLGRLAPGYAADIVLIDLERITWPWAAPEVDPRDYLLLRAKAGDVRQVLIAGETVFAEGKATRFDAAAAGRALAEMLAAQVFPKAAAQRVKALTPLIEAHYAGWEEPPLHPHIAYNSKT